MRGRGERAKVEDRVAAMQGLREVERTTSLMQWQGDLQKINYYNYL